MRLSEIVIKGSSCFKLPLKNSTTLGSHTYRQNDQEHDIDDQFSDACPGKDLLVFRHQDLPCGPHPSNTMAETEEKEGLNLENLG